jgi:hypothetical protein
MTGDRRRRGKFLTSLRDADRQLRPPGEEIKLETPPRRRGALLVGAGLV